MEKEKLIIYEAKCECGAIYIKTSTGNPPKERTCSCGRIVTYKPKELKER
jgi:deoxyribose-phosphate aldolase